MSLGSFWHSEDSRLQGFLGGALRVLESYLLGTLGLGHAMYLI